MSVNRLSDRSPLNKLRALKKLCKNPPSGFVLNQWFAGVKQRYPLHFLVYASGTEKYQQEKAIARSKIAEEISIKTNVLLQLPLDESDLKVIRKMQKQINQLLAKKSLK